MCSFMATLFVSNPSGTSYAFLSIKQKQLMRVKQERRRSWEARQYINCTDKFKKVLLQDREKKSQILCKIFTFLVNTEMSLALEGQSWFLILLEGGCVDKVERPDESKHTQQDPNKKVVAQTKGKSCSFGGQSLIHQSQGWTWYGCSTHSCHHWSTHSLAFFLNSRLSLHGAAHFSPLCYCGQAWIH